jgi:hypothetical protein
MKKNLNILLLFVAINLFFQNNQLLSQGSANNKPWILFPLEGRHNIALNKKVYSSSFEAGLVAQNTGNAVDGDPLSRFSTSYSDSPQWILIDLAGVYEINHVRILWQASRSTEYKLEISLDSINWTEVYSVKERTGALDDIMLDPCKCRYVRLYATKKIDKWGHSIFEFEVFPTDKLVDPLPFEPNLAFKKTIYSSSIETKDSKAENAVDGVTASRWASKLGIDPQWLYIDLKEKKLIGSVKVIWQTSRPVELEYQVSDDAKTWKSVYSGINEVIETTEPDAKFSKQYFNPAVKGRYFRMLGKTRFDKYGYSIFEIMLFPPLKEGVSKN